MDNKDSLWELIYSQTEPTNSSAPHDDKNNAEKDESEYLSDDLVDIEFDEDEIGIQSRDHISHEKSEMIRLSNKRRFGGYGVYSSQPFLGRLVKRNLPKFYTNSPEVRKI